MNTDILLAVTAGILLLTGLIGTVMPILPGVPLAWAGLLTAHFCKITATPLYILIITGITALTVTILDSLLQPYITKKAGGSKKAVLGATIGLIASLFLGPLFIITGPFIGAFIGELIQDPDSPSKAIKAAVGSLFGFLIGTGIKMICVISYIWIFLFELLSK